jgi:ubiquinone/menaquinone biosynthesis C-methylase UbiE
MQMTTEQTIKEEVRKRYGAAAVAAQQKTDGGCCGDGSAVGESNPISSRLYETDELQHLPQEAVTASLGCGNPVAVAALSEGEVVLDLGSGGGIDVLLSARRVGPAGKAYGLDMTDEMLALAKENAAKAGVSNVQFLRGEMENIPLPAAEVDVIISNCVVNLSPDKDAVLREAFRVLKPEGRIAIADIVTRGELPEAVKKSIAAWTGCVAGALSIDDYTSKLQAAGFENIEIEPFREYTADDATSGGFGEVVRASGKAAGEGLGILSAVVRARRPAGSATGEIPVVAGNPATACEPGTCC